LDVKKKVELKKLQILVLNFN